MSGLVLTTSSAGETATPRGDALLQAILPTPPTAARTFVPGDVVDVYAEIYDNVLQTPEGLDITTTIQTMNGQIVFSSHREHLSQASASGQAFPYGLEVPLKGLAAGAYVLRVEVRSPSEQLDQPFFAKCRLPFSISYGGASMRLWKCFVLVTVLGLGTLFAVEPRVAAQAAGQPQDGAQTGRGAGRGAGRGRGPGPREVWAAQPIPETPYTAPNRLIWRLSEIIASHKGQPSWRQAVVKTRDFEGTFIQMAPGEKTNPRSSIPTTALFGWWNRDKSAFDMAGQEPFVASTRKGFLV